MTKKRKTSKAQIKAESDWCKRQGLADNEFNRSLAPVISGEWLPIEKS